MRVRVSSRHPSNDDLGIEGSCPIFQIGHPSPSAGCRWASILMNAGMKNGSCEGTSVGTKLWMSAPFTSRQSSQSLGVIDDGRAVAVHLLEICHTGATRGVSVSGAGRTVRGRDSACRSSNFSRRFAASPPDMGQRVTSKRKLGRKSPLRKLHRHHLNYAAGLRDAAIQASSATGPRDMVHDLVSKLRRTLWPCATSAMKYLDHLAGARVSVHYEFLSLWSKPLSWRYPQCRSISYDS